MLKLKVTKYDSDPVEVLAPTVLVVCVDLTHLLKLQLHKRPFSQQTFRLFLVGKSQFY